MNNSLVLRTAAAALLVIGAFQIHADERKIMPEFVEGTTRVNAEQLVDLVSQKSNLVIVDTRKAEDFQKGFIEGAVSLPNTETNKETLSKVIKSKGTPVVFYCNGIYCHRSMEAAKMALASGYTNVYWFRGGIEEWNQKGLPITKP